MNSLRKHNPKIPFKHFLITRFNLKVPDWQLTKNKESLLTEEWMAHRMELFENFCLPSVLSQSNQNFTWLIYFDTTTSLYFKNKISSIINGNKQIKLIYINGMSAFSAILKKNIQKKSEKIPYLITTRLDNDDCIHKDFVETIQQQFNFQDFMAIDLTEGYSLQIEPQVRLGKKTQLYNPFISLIEKNNTPTTVCMRAHGKWKSENRIIHIKNKRVWLAIIHHKNKINEFDGFGKVEWMQLKNDFAVSDKMSRYISENAIPIKKWFFLGLKNKLLTHYTILIKQFKKSIGVYHTS